MGQCNVALVPMDTYDQHRVDEAVAQGVALLGGISSFVSPEEKILIKPNLLSKALPQKAVTTHPAVFEAVAKLLLKEGCTHVTYGDSPATTAAAAVADSCGIAEAARKLGIPLADFTTGSVVHYPKGRVGKSFMLCTGVQEADALISVCKMKTHALERITGAVKNQYGCILGLNKGAGHMNYPNSDVFADMLIDLNQYLRPRLYIMDGITAMEGNGPSSGTPVNMNVLLFSQDPVALDALFAALVHLDPAEIPTCVSGEKAGLGTMAEEQIQVLTPEGPLTVGEAVARYGKADFDVFRGTLKKHALGRLALLLPFMQERPRVVKEKCVACGVCQQVCPVPEKAVHSGNGQKAVYDYKRCIHCFCCQEMCPAKAIEVHHNPLTRFLKK